MHAHSRQSGECLVPARKKRWQRKSRISQVAASIDTGPNSDSLYPSASAQDLANSTPHSEEYEEDEGDEYYAGRSSSPFPSPSNASSPSPSHKASCFIDGLALSRLSARDRRAWICAPLPANHRARCLLFRNKSLLHHGNGLFYLGLEDQLSPWAESILEMAPSLWACKRKHSYLISGERKDLSRTRFERSAAFCGKVTRMNRRSDYVIFDCGANPDSPSKIPQSLSLGSPDIDASLSPKARLRSPRQQLASIAYRQSSKYTSSNLLDMHVTLGEIRNRASSRLTHRADTGQNMAPSTSVGEGLYPVIHGLQDHKSRIVLESVKNVQLKVLESAQDDFQDPPCVAAPGYEPSPNYLLDFRKVGHDVWSLEFTHPMSMLQAFGVALTRFDI
jgi:hypothetical protein